jgi:hypothetical protein
VKERLRAVWSKREADILYHYPRSCDGALLHYHFDVLRDRALEGVRPEGRSLIEELVERGYDITTLRFSVDRFEVEGPPRPPVPVLHDCLAQGCTEPHGAGKVV